MTGMMRYLQRRSNCLLVSSPVLYTPSWHWSLISLSMMPMLRIWLLLQNQRDWKADRYLHHQYFLVYTMNKVEAMFRFPVFQGDFYCRLQPVQIVLLIPLVNFF